MKINSLALLGLMLVLLAGVARAQEKVTADPVSDQKVKLGQSAPVQFTFHVRQGFHINSNQPTEPELIPTRLTFSLPEDLVMAKLKYPPGMLMSLAFDPKTKLSVYSGDVVIHAVLLPQPKASIGTFTVHAELKYQACDDSACYPPKRLPIAFNVKILSNSSGRRARPNAQSPHIHN
jgi:Disulphide bond corrector protein DsbC